MRKTHVGAELQGIPLCRKARVRSHDAGVREEHIEAVLPLQDKLGRRVDGIEVREVQVHKLEGTGSGSHGRSGWDMEDARDVARRAGLDLGDGLGGALLTPARDVDLGAALVVGLGGFVARSGVGSGDEDDLGSVCA